MKVYTPELKSAGVFGPEDVNTLKAAFDTTCKRLKIPAEDVDARHRIMKQLIELASAGDRDLDSLSSAIRS